VIVIFLSTCKSSNTFKGADDCEINHVAGNRIRDHLPQRAWPAVGGPSVTVRVAAVIADAVAGDMIDFAVIGTLMCSTICKSTKISRSPDQARRISPSALTATDFQRDLGTSVISGLTLSSGWDLFEDVGRGGAIYNSATLVLKFLLANRQPIVLRGGAVANVWRFSHTRRRRLHLCR